jgi:dGTP triphosphohydrolase
MSYFWLGASKGTPESGTKTFPEKAYNLISLNYRRVAEKEINKVAKTGKSASPPEEIYHRAKLVVDYIAGMTDTFAQSLHRRLFNG